MNDRICIKYPRGRMEMVLDQFFPCTQRESRIKHNRNKIETYGSITQENYKFANQENVLNALAGLYQLEQYLYSLLAHDPHEETPLPGSRLYRLKDCGWEKKQFGRNMVLYVEEDGILHGFEKDVYYEDI